MKLKIVIDMSNSAFDPIGTEAARILRELAQKLDGEQLQVKDLVMLRDVKGNRVGEAKVTR